MKGPPPDTHRTNDQIRITPVRVVDHEGKMRGVIPTIEALQIARDAEMDLVEVAPDERPPVCRIMDYGKFKYEQGKKKKDGAKTHQQQLKEIRLRPRTGDHDIDFKLKQARGFLEDRDKVKISVTFKGRENVHQELGRALIQSVIAKLEDIGKVEKMPMFEGKTLTAVIAPK
jgi:translation initiation factor IF-3